MGSTDLYSYITMCIFLPVELNVLWLSYQIKFVYICIHKIDRCMLLYFSMGIVCSQLLASNSI